MEGELMSQIRIPLANPQDVLIVGYDKPFDTYYAQLYTHALDDRRKSDEPDKAVGYHPIERSANEITDHGSYPCDLVLLERTLTEWGLSSDAVSAAVIAAREDGPQ